MMAPELGMVSHTRISNQGTVNLPAHIRRDAGLEDGGPVMVSVVDGESRIRALHKVLTALQDQARIVFANTDETVDRFITERRSNEQRDTDALE